MTLTVRERMDTQTHISRIPIAHYDRKQQTFKDTRKPQPNQA